MRFRKIDPRIWGDEKFRQLKHEEMLVAFYCLTSAQANRIGIFRFSPAHASEDLETLPQTFAKRFDRVIETLKWGWDSAARVLYLPTWWKYNKPMNPNTFKAHLDDFHELPSSPLLAEFCANTRYVSDAMAEHLRNVTRNITPNITPNVSHQEKEKEKEQEKETERESPHGPLVTLIEYPNGMDTPEVRQAITDWLAYRKKSGKTYKDPGEQVTRLLKQFGDASTFCAGVDHSIAQGYIGCFPPGRGGGQTPIDVPNPRDHKEGRQ